MSDNNSDNYTPPAFNKNGYSQDDLELGVGEPTGTPNVGNAGDNESRMGAETPEVDEVAKEALKAKKSKKDKKPLTPEQQAQNKKAFQKQVGIGLGVVLVGSLAYGIFAMTAEQERAVEVKSNNAVAIKTEPSEIGTQEQRENERNLLTEKANSEGVINISDATKRTVAKGKYSIDEILQNPKKFQGFKQDNEQYYVDIETNEVYDDDGNLLTDMQPPDVYANQPVTSYSNLTSAQGQAGSPAIDPTQRPDPNSQAQAQQQYAQQAQSQQQAQPQAPKRNIISSNGEISPQLQNTLAQIDSEKAIYEANRQANNTTYTDTIAQQNAYWEAHRQTVMEQTKAFEEYANGLITNAVQTYSGNGNGTSFSTTNRNVVYRNADGSIYDGSTTAINGAGRQAELATFFPNSQGGTVGNGTTGNGLLPRGVLRKGTQMLVMATSEVNTDKGTTFNGMVLDGHYSGAKITGQVVVGERDIGITFDTILPRNPRHPAVSISARALNTMTQTDGVATSINRHTIRNGVEVVAKSVLQGYGEAYSGSTATETTINRADGTVITTRDGAKVSPDEIRGKAYGALNDHIQSKTEHWGQRKPTYKIAQGTIITLQLEQDLDTRLGANNGNGSIGGNLNAGGSTTGGGNANSGSGKGLQAQPLTNQLDQLKNDAR